jgi:aspartyl-tRNA(Asn)/glutamyl-tRNA(Gln) amidotransferase subunit C
MDALARLAHLRVPEDGIDRLAEQLDQVLGWLAGLQSVDVEGVGADEALEEGAVRLREDAPGPVLDREAALAAAPEVDDGRIVVPRFVEE